MNEQLNLRYLDLWQQAVLSPSGISVTTDDSVLLRQQLYRARVESGREEFSRIGILFISVTELYLVPHAAR